MAKFLEKRGEGIHHLSVEVKGLANDLAELGARGIQLIDKSPRTVREKEEVAFLDPKSTNGVLIELSQEIE